MMDLQPLIARLLRRQHTEPSLWVDKRHKSILKTSFRQTVLNNNKSHPEELTWIRRAWRAWGCGFSPRSVVHSLARTFGLHWCCPQSPAHLHPRYRSRDRNADSARNRDGKRLKGEGGHLQTFLMSKKLIKRCPLVLKYPPGILTGNVWITNPRVWRIDMGCSWWGWLAPIGSVVLDKLHISAGTTMDEPSLIEVVPGLTTGPVWLACGVNGSWTRLK